MRYFIYCRKSSEGEERQVLSLASQQEAIAKAFGDKSEIEIVGVYEEAKSAKTPGRPLFAEMLRRIEGGEADGIASWAPDRLARNSIDGGHVIYLLDQGLLRDLKFATYTFENNSQGKFMLSIMFGQSKYYSDALSENVKRGNATKVAMGWRPNRAPLGYINCPLTKTTIPDPNQFPIIRHVFDLFLTGTYTPRQIVKIAQNEWGFLTPRAGRSGGRPLGRSTIYQTLSNPFYKGVIVWGGAEYPGKHEPMITPEEFEMVQTLLDQRYVARPQREPFLFTGILTCGKCGRAITAERKTNRYGQRYTYYHCAARGRIAGACDEPSVEEVTLTQQFRAFLAALYLPCGMAAWAGERLRADLSDAQARATQFATARLAAIAEIGTQLRELTSLRLRRLMTDDEFTQERRRLEESRVALEKAETPSFNGHVIELLEMVERISKYALDWFDRATNVQKQKLIKIVCSNPTLTGKKLCVQAVKPFFTTLEFTGCPRLLGDVDEVRTFTGEYEQILKDISGLKGQSRVKVMLLELQDLEHDFHSVGPLPKMRKRRADAGLPRTVSVERGKKGEPVRPPFETTSRADA